MKLLCLSLIVCLNKGEGWNGRIKACRGIGASLTGKEISMREQEHRELLERIAPNEFDILHYGAIAELKKQ